MHGAQLQLHECVSRRRRLAGRLRAAARQHARTKAAAKVVVRLERAGPAISKAPWHDTGNRQQLLPCRRMRVWCAAGLALRSPLPPLIARQPVPPLRHRPNGCCPAHPPGHQLGPDVGACQHLVRACAAAAAAHAAPPISGAGPRCPAQRRCCAFRRRGRTWDRQRGHADRRPHHQAAALHPAWRSSVPPQHRWGLGNLHAAGHGAVRRRPRLRRAPMR